MRKKVLIFVTATMIFSLFLFAGCGAKQGTENTPSTQPTNTEAPTDVPTNTPEPTATPTPESTATPTSEPTATPTPEPTATPTPEPTATPTPEPTATPTPEPTATPTPEPTATPTPEPTATPTPEPTATPTPEPTAMPTPVPIVKAVGDVDSDAYEKAERVFTNVVLKMRADGLITYNDVCVVMDSTSIKVDITFDNAETDILLCKDESTGIYTLTLDYDFIWLEGFGAPINGIDPAEYNRELLMALLSMISGEPRIVFDIIDQTYFSSYYLGDKAWTAVGDCYMMDGDTVIEKQISYKITKEVPAATYTRDASTVLSLTRADGSTVECVVEYDSSLVKNDKGMLSPADETTDLFGSALLYNGGSTYEDYEAHLLRFIREQMEDNSSVITISGIEQYTANGFTYYFLEAFYDGYQDPDIVYVQITDDVFIEMFNVWFTSTLEEFVNTAFYISEVKEK